MGKELEPIYFVNGTQTALPTQKQTLALLVCWVLDNKKV